MLFTTVLSLIVSSDIASRINLSFTSLSDTRSSLSASNLLISYPLVACELREVKEIKPIIVIRKNITIIKDTNPKLTLVRSVVFLTPLTAYP